MCKYLFVLFPVALAAQPETLPLPDSTFHDAEVWETDTSSAPYNEEYYAPYVPPPIEPLALREPRAKDWEKAVNGLDYSADQPKERKEREHRTRSSGEPFAWLNAAEGLGNVLQVLAVLVAICVIGYGIYWMLQGPRNRALAQDGTEITLDNLDEYIHETDLDRYLREALAASHWPLALRVYFLMCIKSLSDAGAIKWSREKTNRDYLREMRQHPSSASFRQLTLMYEKVWYGNQPLSADAFREIEAEFQRFLNLAEVQRNTTLATPLRPSPSSVRRR
jgi:hypothetical protein